MDSGRSLHCPVSFMFELSHQKGTLQIPSWKVPSCSTDVSQEPLQDVWWSVTEDVIACSLHVKRSKLLGNLIFLFFFFSKHIWIHVCRCIRGTCMSRSQLLHFLEALAELRTHPFWLVKLGDLLTSVNSLPQESLLSSSSVLGFKHALPVGSSGSGNPDSGPDACPPSLPSPSLTLFSLEVKDFCWFVV